MAVKGIWVTGPNRTPLPHRLTAVADVVPMANEKAALGVNYESQPPVASIYGDATCLPEADRTEKEFDARFYVESVETTLYAGVECGFKDWQDYEGFALERLELGESAALERFLREGIFSDESTLLTPAGSSLAVTFGELEAEAIAEYEGVITVHITPVVASALNADGLVEMTSDGLRTINGSKVVVGAGYINDDGVGSGSNAAAGESWAFATGDIVIHRGTDAVTHGNLPVVNVHATIAERQYAITVDGPIIATKLILEGA